jgi:hypothetical protein
VLDEYRDYLPLTVRQVFYRLVGAFGYEKTELAYARLGDHLVNARRARVIPFNAIRDDGAVVMRAEHFADEDDFWTFVRTESQRYRRDKLANQAVYLETWCEAAGMMPQLARVANAYSIGVYSSSGFDSLTAKREVVDRICAVGKPAVVLHLGDYDPSGVSIFDVVAEDVARFVAEDRPWGGVDVTFRRVALTREQVMAYDLPTAPPKASDSRAKRWQGETCQLEALAPDQIAALLNDAILGELDLDQLAADQRAEQRERLQIAYALPAGRGDATTEDEA